MRQALRPINGLVACAASLLATLAVGCAQTGRQASDDAAVDAATSDAAIIDAMVADRAIVDSSHQDSSHPPVDASHPDMNVPDMTLPVTACPTGARDVIINEVNFAPRSTAAKTALHYEYVELYNRGSQSVTLDGWKIINKKSAIWAQLPSGTNAIVMPPASFLLVFSSAAGTDPAIIVDLDLSDGQGTFVAPTSKTLANTGDAARLYCAWNLSPYTIVSFVAFAEHGGFQDLDAGTGEADPTVDDDAVAAGLWVDGYAVDTLTSTGRSIALTADGVNPNVATEPGLDWMQYPNACPGTSLPLGGTPGEPNASGCPAPDGGTDGGTDDGGAPPPTSCLPSAANVVINEIMYAPKNSDPAQIAYEYVELYNRGDSEVNLGGWLLVNAQQQTFAALPSGGSALILPPRAFLAVYTAAAIAQLSPDVDFSDGSGVWISSLSPAALPNAGGSVMLYCSSLFSPDTIVDYVAYAEHGGSYDADAGIGEADPTVDNDAVTAGLWVYGYAVDTIPSGTTGRAIALTLDGQTPSKTTLPGLDWMQYSGALCADGITPLGGTPGRPNASGCPALDAGSTDDAAAPIDAAITD